MTPLTVTYIIALSLLFAAPAPRAECPPSLIGSPCAAGGLANVSQMEPALTLAAGNPVHLATGNKYQQDIDLPPNPTSPGLELIRHYNTMDVRKSVLGRGWALSYDTRLHRINTGWQISQADGSRVSFPDHSTGPDNTQQNLHGRLDHLNDHHNWFWPSGTVIRFNQSGYLVAIRWPSGESVYVDRHDDHGPLKGAIKRVHNDRAQALDFEYDTVDGAARLAAVDTPLGRFSYHYDAPLTAQLHVVHSPHRLIRVTRPDTMQRHYLHEPALQNGHPYALTGIEIVSPATKQRQRTNTWTYDAHGRAIKSISGDPQSTRNLLQLDYQQSPSAHQAGLTAVSDEHGKKTYFHTAIKGGRYVLTSVQGAGCFGCAAPGTQADYDEQGRLVNVNRTRIERTESGAIRTLYPAQSGWPELTLSYNTDGLRDHWGSAVTGAEQIQYDAQGLPVGRHFANGDTAAVEYDVQHRPVKVQEKHGEAQATTQLSWYGHRLIRIEHPAETESRRYDDAGRATEREVTRYMQRPGHRLHIKDGLSYDNNHRITRHQLPEGGSLHYTWGQGEQLKAIYWQDISGLKHPIIETVPGKPGYRYGNGLHLDTQADPDHLIRQLRLRNQDHLMWSQELSYDSQHRITAETHYSDTGLSSPSASTWHYAYDEYSRLAGHHRSTVNDIVTDGIAATTTTDTTKIIDDVATSWLAWDAGGTAAATRTLAKTTRPTVRRDPSGLAMHADGYDLSYGAGRRLNKVMRDGQLVAQYQHNAFGYRISRQTPGGQRSDYFYLNNQLVAQADQHEPAGDTDAVGAVGAAGAGADENANANANANTSQPSITRRYVYAHHVPVAIIDYSPQTPEGQYFSVHADLQGAPRLMTDQDRRVRWHADYSPLGKAINVSGDMQLELRLPGQTEDAATGWHDNLLRTYQPDWGHYLEPDPLGPVPGNQAYGYASQQPRRYADPMGLLLFAFDGTRKSAAAQSNVWKISQYYLDGPVHYHPGPGNSVFINWDAVTAHQASQIIETQWKWLLHELSRPQAATEVTPIDILGFSRGAALARHFGNMISQHVNQGLFYFNDPLFGSVSACVDLRFMGLFDTVAQFGIGGTQNRNYDLSIAAAWEWVAHAVALHERRWLFPLTSASSTHVHNVVEAPFIGAHADIGGGVLPANRDQPGGRGDLSNVALNWMIWQARAASVPLGDISDEHGAITEPLLHDFRSTTLRTVQDGDRRVDTSSGQSWLNYQDDHPRLGRPLRTQTERLITRRENWRSDAGVEVGTVDMDGYMQWLHDELGWHALPV